MRGALGRRLPNPNGYNLTSIAKHAPFLSQPTSHFSSSGRGRGRGAAIGDGGFSVGRGQFDFSRTPVNSTEPENPKRDSPEPLPSVGHGHGRGRPIPPDPISPAFSSFVSSIKPASPGVGRGRGAAGPGPVPPFTTESSRPPPSGHQEEQPPEKPIFVKLQEIKESTSSPDSESGKTIRPSDLIGALKSVNSHDSRANVFGSGAGRGKPATGPGPAQQMQEENRHIRRAQPQQPQPQQQQQQQPQQQQQQQHQQNQERSQGIKSQESPSPKLSKEEALKRARSALMRGDAGGGRGRGGRGRGRGRGRGWGRGRGRETDGWKEEGEAEAMSVFAGNNADGEKFAEKVGPETMSKLTEALEGVLESIPSPADEAYLDALETNLMIECEPEYLLPDFESNDIDEKPPMSLRDCLEKVKPFLMNYEGIQSQEEWEEAVNEVMETAPLIKEIVDHYGGPDRITAKVQNEELERVAKTLPESAPYSVKRFTDRAVLSLQSNPGWGFDKKYQFMDKLVREVSQQYK